jgi:hypothetical protein
MSRAAWLAGTIALLSMGCDPGAISAIGGGNGTIADGDGGQVPGQLDGQGAAEVCNGFDDDQDGEVDEGCSCTVGKSQLCFPGPSAPITGICKQGTQVCEGSTEFTQWGACVGAVTPQKEICGNTIDEDCDGSDLQCPPVKACAPGQTKSCYSGPVGTQNKGPCKAGTQTCLPSGQWGACIGEVTPAKEICDNTIDEDCNGKNEKCPVVPVMLLLIGDCVTASCPPSDPYPVGCLVFLSGNDHRGCVANTPGSSVVYFQEGDKCDKGLVTGTIYCSKKQGAPLSFLNCPLNKKLPIYPQSSSGCP